MNEFPKVEGASQGHARGRSRGCLWVTIVCLAAALLVLVGVSVALLVALGTSAPLRVARGGEDENDADIYNTDTAGVGGTEESD